MRAGLLTEEITIQAPVTIKDIYGADTIRWDDVISTRSQVSFNSGQRQNLNNEIVHSYTITFTIRYYHNINERMIIVWKGNRYKILSINREIHKQSITIITELINE